MIILKANLDDISVIKNEKEMEAAGFIKKQEVTLTPLGSFISRIIGINSHLGNDSEFYDVKQFLRRKEIITNLKSLRDYCSERDSTFFRIDSWDRVYLLDANEDEGKTFTIYAFRHDLYSINERKKKQYDLEILG